MRSISILLLLDIDGTIVSSKDRDNVPLELTNKLNEFVLRGGNLSLVTGRSYDGCKKILEGVPVNFPLILLSGALAFDNLKKEVIFSYNIESSAYNLIEYVFENFNNVSITINTVKDSFNLRKTEFLLQKGTICDKNAPLCNLSDLNINIPLAKILFSSYDTEVLKEIKNITNSYAGLKSEFASRHFLEVVAKGINKGSSIARLKSLILPTNNEEVIYVGDGLTDVKVKPYVSKFFTLDNASSEVKNHADFVLPSVYDVGLLSLLKNLLR